MASVSTAPALTKAIASVEKVALQSAAPVATVMDTSSQPEQPTQPKQSVQSQQPAQPQSVATQPTNKQPTKPQSSYPKSPKSGGHNSPTLASLEQSMALLHQHQAETLKIHQLYLENQEAYTQSVFQLLQQYYTQSHPLETGVQPEALQTQPHPEPFETSVQPETLKFIPTPPSPHISETPSSNNGSQLEPLTDSLDTPPPPIQIPIAFTSPPPIPTTPSKPTPLIEVAPPQPTIDDTALEALTDLMLSVVSEKTGYPIEVLELEMDLEGDLGIDSIKRVEILGAMQDRYPDLPSVNPEDLAELRTLGQIVQYMGTDTGSGSSVAPSAPIQPVSAPVQPMSEPVQPVSEPASVTPAQTTNMAELTNLMLSVVSEKTGYPIEVLELEMDLEGDLGIDSIKRVEILGAMQDRYPDLPSVNPEDLAELRTLGQIVQYMGTDAGNGSSVAPSAPIQPVSAPVQPVPVPVQPMSESASVAPAQTTNMAELTDLMLSVVSEKTGYPIEVLELEMDLEGDLGIDSIKRVEILGAMQDRYPDLPSVNPEDLAELRTLGQIVQYMDTDTDNGTDMGNGSSIAPSAPVQPVSAPAPVAPAQTTNMAELTQSMLSVVSEKTGYPIEVLELEMDLEGDLGIDSIKRVEILGTMQDRYPNLPSVNPEDLAEIRTLGGIVDYLGKPESASASTEVVSTVGNAQISAKPTNSIPTHNISRNLVSLQPLAPPDFLACTLPHPYMCLLTDDGTETTLHLAKMLTERDWKVLVLSFPQTIVTKQSALPQGVQRITLKDMSEQHLQQQLTALASNNGPIGAFIHLNPNTAHNNPNQAKAIVKQVFFIAKHLKPSLNKAAELGRACFITVAHLDGALGLGNETAFNPIDGGLFGLTKSLNLEWPQVFCRAIDLHPHLAPEQTAHCILAELYDPNRLIVEVGYGHQGRTTLVAQSSLLTTSQTSNNAIKQINPITPNSVFVVSGGAKGITAHCVIKLAQQHHCKFILLGRSSITNLDTSWLTNYADEAALKRLVMDRLISQGEKPTPAKIQQLAKAIRSKNEIEQTLQAIQQAGGQAEYLSVDVTDASMLQQQLIEASKRLGTITGLIHGAGVLSDKLIEKKLEQDFEAVYTTKVQGLQALLSCIPPQQLHHLVLFSSAAGFYGNVGQADYALANDVLNKTAYLIKQQHPACHVVSIGWGPWDGGMVTPALKKLFTERNIEVIPVDVGAQLLVNELNPSNHPIVQTVVGGSLVVDSDTPTPTLNKHRIYRRLSVEANPFLQDHIIGEHPVLPTVCAIAWMGNVCEQLYPGYKLFSCDHYQVLKGIVFDEEHAAKDYVLDLEEVGKTPEQVVFKAVIWSNNPEGKTRYHYRAEIVLLKNLPEPPTYANFDNSETHPILNTDLYQNGTLFHGPNFQGVERVLNINPNKLTMRCVLPKIEASKQGQFPVQTFNPYIADGQFQSMVIWARHFHQAGSLPLQTQRGEQYRPIPFGETSYVSMEVKNSTDTKLVADIITHDAQGKVYAQVLDAEVTISKQLNHLFVPSKSVSNGGHL